MHLPSLHDLLDLGEILLIGFFLLQSIRLNLLHQYLPFQEKHPEVSFWTWFIKGEN